MNIQGWFPLGLTGLISLLSKGLSRVFSSTTIWNHQFFGIQPSFWSTLISIHDYWKNHSFDYMDLSSNQSLSRVRLFETPWIAAGQASLSITNSQSSPKLLSIESVMPSSHLIFCHPLFLLPSIFPGIIGKVQWVGSSCQVAKLLGLQLQHQSFQWIFRVDFL